MMAPPYHEDESIDEEGLRKQVDFAIGKGAAAVCVPGFGTEFYKLSDPERYRVADVVLEHTARHKPVIISTGSGSIYSTIEFSRRVPHLSILKGGIPQHSTPWDLTIVSLTSEF
jgi:4-hydroxy-tetrahydrodipicolinate synthase